MMPFSLSTWPSILQAMAALLAVLGLVVLAARAARRFGLAPASGRRLALAEALPLDTRRKLLLIRCDGREALLLTGGGQDAWLGWLPEQR